VRHVEHDARHRRPQRIEDRIERIVAEKGVTDTAALARYRDAWDRAAERTPHGAPITLQPEDFAS